MTGEGGKDRTGATMSSGEMGVVGAADVEEVPVRDRDGIVMLDSRVDVVECFFWGTFVAVGDFGRSEGVPWTDDGKGIREGDKGGRESTGEAGKGSCLGDISTGESGKGISAAGNVSESMFNVSPGPDLLAVDCLGVA